MEENIKFDANELHPEGIVAAVVRSFKLEAVDLDSCTAAVKALIIALATVILTLIKKELNITGELQEYIDKLTYQANMDSSNSSSRPSSDMPWGKNGGKGKKKTSTDGKTETNGKQKNPAVSKKGADPDADKGTQDSDDADNDNFEEQEGNSEKALRANHERSLRTNTGRPAGKQVGSKGFGFKIPESAKRNETFIIPPDRCVNCPNWKECSQNHYGEERAAHNVVDIKIVVEVTPYKPVRVVCPKRNGEVLESDYPENATAPNQYGINLKTLLCIEYIPGMMSLGRIHDIFASMLGLKISQATVLGFLSQLADKIRPSMSVMFEYLKTVPVVNLDETGANINGKLHWIHTISTELYTFLSLQETKGKDAMDKIGFLKEYIGCIVHDCFTVYWNYDVIHAICNGHLIRELIGVSRFFKDANKWADDMTALLREMVHTKNEAMRAGQTSLSPEVIQGFSDRFDALIARGKEIHPERALKYSKRRLKQGRARNLVCRMERRKEEIFLSIRRFDVPFTNNTAEASFRMVSKHFRVAGCFKNVETAKDYVMIWAYLSTARKHHTSYYEAVRQAFTGNALDVIFPDGVPECVQDKEPEEKAA